MKISGVNPGESDVVDPDKEILLRQRRRAAAGLARMQITRVVVEFLRVEDAGFEIQYLRDLGVGGRVLVPAHDRALRRLTGFAATALFRPT